MPEPLALHDRIAGLFSGALNIDVPSIHTDLFESGVLDSLALVELLLQLEREFGVTVSSHDLEVENFRTIAHISTFVRARTERAAEVVSSPRVVQLRTRR